MFRNTRMPVSAVFENLEAGATIDEIIEQFDITREQINAVLEFAARSLDAPTLHRSGNQSAKPPICDVLRARTENPRCKAGLGMDRLAAGCR